MVKLVFLCRRRSDLTHERYVERLLGGHVPLALRHHPTLRRYVVNVVEDTRGPAPPLDSIGELWFDTLADYRERLYDSPAGAGIIARDVAGFMGSAAAYVTTEHVRGRICLSPAGQAEIEADIPRFIARVHAYLVAEYVERW